jgi:hypothetical protein
MMMKKNKVWQQFVSDFEVITMMTISWDVTPCRQKFSDISGCVREYEEWAGPLHLLLPRCLLVLALLSGEVTGRLPHHPNTPFLRLSVPLLGDLEFGVNFLL